MARFPSDRPKFTSYGLSCVRWIPGPMQRPDHHNEIQLNMLVRGRVTYLLSDQKVHVQQGRLTAFWAAIPHQITDYAPETEYFVATLPLAWFLQCQLPDVLVQPLMRGQVVTEPQPERADFDSVIFRQWAADLSANSRVLRKIVTVEMETRLQRLAVTLESAKSGHQRRASVKLQMSGLTKLDHEHYLRTYHTKKNPHLVVRLDVMKRFRDRLGDLGPILHAQFQKAVGAHPNVVAHLQRANEQALAALNIEPTV